MARLVIAEDHVHIRNVLTMWMSRHGHEVLGAPDGRVALEFLKAQPVELLITDVNMPVMDGLELVRLAFPACPTLRRAFVVTSRCDQHQILTELADPRVSIFPKPFSPTQLLRAVEKVMAEAEAERSAGAPTPAVPPVGSSDPGERP